MPHPYLLPLPPVGSAATGRLAFAERDTLPFPVRRVYWVYEVPQGHVRGRHAHRQLEQLLVAVHGTLEIVVGRPGPDQQTFRLTHPAEALYLPPGSWREIRFGPGAVLLCLASHEYDEEDYER